MSQESAQELRDAVPDLNDARLDQLVNSIYNDKPDSQDDSTSKIVSPYLHCANVDHLDDKGGLHNQTLRLIPESNTHTPLLSASSVSHRDNDNENITDTEDLVLENSKETTEHQPQQQYLPQHEALDAIDTENNPNLDPQFQQFHDLIPHLPTMFTPYHILSLRRQEFTNINYQQQDGMLVYYIDPSWLQIFLEHEFDENDPSIDEKMGPVKTLPQDDPTKRLPISFIPLEQFKLLIDWFTLDPGHQIIERELVYSKKEKKLILDMHPLTISPHIFCNTASQASRYNQVQSRKASKIQFSAMRTVSDFYHFMLAYFDIDQSSLSSVRIWHIDFESSSSPLVLIPSTLKFIKRKQLLNKKKTKIKTLHERHVISGDYMIEFKQPDGIYFLDIESHVLAGSGLVGLNNLGNTCYMNSALQCLVHIRELNSYFLYHFFEKEINKENPLGNKGKVAMAFGSLISSIFDNRYAGNQSSYSPKEFKYTIGHFNSLFADYRQQDSQEFIAYLLDGLHEDLNRVLQKPYVEKPELEHGKENDIEAIKDLAEKCWIAHKMRNNSIIVDLFVSLYKSTLVCPTCNNVSITFDPYNDLTLPLPVTKKWTHELNILPAQGYPIVLEAQLNKNETYSDLKNFVSKYMNISESDLIGVEIDKNIIFKNYEDPSSDARYLPISELISPNEVVWFYEVKDFKSHTVIPVFSTVLHNNDRHNFGLPFFISLTDEERYSYGLIQKKMCQKYQQLSTSKLFVKINEFEYGKYKPSDFERIDLFFKYFNLGPSPAKCCNDNMHDNDDASDAKSDISYATPEYSLESVYTAKLIDSSMEKSYFNRHHYSRYTSTLKLRPTSESEIWFPENVNTLKRSDLPNLMDKVSMVKKFYYAYSPANCQIILDQLNSAEQNGNGQPVTRSSSSNEEDYYDVEEKENGAHEANDSVDNLMNDISNDSGTDEDENMASLNHKMLIDKKIERVANTLETNNASANSLVDNDDGSEMEGYITAAETLGNGASAKVNEALNSNIANKAISPSTSSAVSSMPASSASSPSAPSSASPSIAKDICSVANDLPEEKEQLIFPRMSIVNEFNEDHFDLCFFSSEEDGEYAGKETWETPEILVNEELERERRENLENANRPVTVYDCLELFSKPETLGQDDLWYCPQCKEHRQATKKIELWSAPDILTIHLKRFESTNSFSDKIDITVDFPIEGLDLTKYVADKDGEHIYDLFAVDNHYGGLGGGHYTAYVKNFVDDKWYYFNDSRVSAVSDPRDAIKGSAYLLFYRKRSDKPLGGDYIQNITSEIEKKCEELRTKLEKFQVEQVANTSSISETSDEEMQVSETSDSPRSYNLQPENPGTESIAIRKGDTVNGIIDDNTYTDMDVDDGKKRRKLGNYSSDDSTKVGSGSVGNGSNPESIEEEDAEPDLDVLIN